MEIASLGFLFARRGRGEDKWGSVGDQDDAEAVIAIILIQCWTESTLRGRLVQFLMDQRRVKHCREACYIETVKLSHRNSNAFAK